MVANLDNPVTLTKIAMKYGIKVSDFVRSYRNIKDYKPYKFLIIEKPYGKSVRTYKHKRGY